MLVLCLEDGYSNQSCWNRLLLQGSQELLESYHAGSILGYPGIPDHDHNLLDISLEDRL